MRDTDHSSGSNARALRVAVIGSGMSGLLMGKKLRDAGIDFQIYEKADEVGGTWRENTYPGLSCDVPAHYYSYNFEPNTDWRYRFARGGEIHDYLKQVADKYGLRRFVRFGCEITRARHDGLRWHLEDSEGEVDQVDAIVAATGVLHHPRWPDVPGVDEFAGPCFHSARWDHSVDLRGKRIAVVGAGSTAVQIVTRLGSEGHDLLSIQRTPQWIFPMPDRSYSRPEKWLVERVPGLSRLIHRVYEFGFERFFAQAVITPGWQRSLVDRIVRWNLGRIRDAALRERLAPPDSPMCKRLIMSGQYYHVVQQDNVDVVRAAVTQIRPEGVVTDDGQLHEADVLVLATGFHAHDYMRPMELETAEGLTLSEVWSQRPRAHRTVGVPGMPDFFMVQGPRSPVGNFSLISIGDTQTDYIMRCLSLLRDGRARSLVPRDDVADQLERDMNEQMPDTVWMSGCNSWYIGPDGLPDSWPSTPARFREHLAQPRLEEFRGGA